MDQIFLKLLVFMACLYLEMARGEKKFSIKKEYYHCGSGVDSTFVDFFGILFVYHTMSSHHTELR
jgi:hypothetical protein